MAACLRGGCIAPAEDGDVGAEGDAKIGTLQRSAAPGRVADHYTFGRTLGACRVKLGSAYCTVC